jgi:ABC-type transporter Mla MlaB component
VSPERATGSLDGAAGLGAGDHVCWTYRSDEERRQVLTTFLVDGSRRGDQLVYWALEGGGDPLLDDLRGARDEVDAFIETGRLVVQPARAVYTPDGAFDPGAMLDNFRVLTAQALQEGRSGLRVATEVAWLLGHPDALAHWDAYELRADLLAAQLPLTVMCGYDMRQCDPAELPIVQAVHQLASPPPAPGTPPLRLYGTADGGLGLEGDLDYRWAGRVESLLTATAGDLRVPLLDISGLQLADVAGMRAVATGARQLARTLDHVELRGASANFRKLWRLLRFDRLGNVAMPT